MKQNIVFFGTPPQAAEVLQEFISANNMHVCGVVTNPDRPVGRKKVLTPTAVKKLALENDIPAFTPEKFGEEEKAQLQALNADFFVIVAYGTLIPQWVIDIPKKGTFNLHFSLLPKWRGASPVQASVLAGEEVSGITIFKLVEALDAGDIFVQKEVPLGEKNFIECIEVMTEVGKKAFIDLCTNFEDFSGKAQKSTDATFCGKFTKGDGLVDPKKQTAEEILRKYRAFFLWPCIFSFDGSQKRIKWTKISLFSQGDQKEKKAGDIFEYEKKVLLQTKKGVLEIEKAQKEGKKESEGKNILPVVL